MSGIIEAAEKSHKKFWWFGAAGAVMAYFLTDASESVKGGLGLLVWIVFDIYGRLEVAEAKAKFFRRELDEKTKELAQMIGSLEYRLDSTDSA